MIVLWQIGKKPAYIKDVPELNHTYGKTIHFHISKNGKSKVYGRYDRVRHGPFKPVNPARQRTLDWWQDVFDNGGMA